MGPTLLGVGAVSAAVLIFEITLNRVFAVTEFYHFAFLTVSLALLGFGASGSVLAVFPGLRRGGPRRLSWLAAAQAPATVGAYAVTNALPLDTFAIAWDRSQIVYLAVYYVVLAVPFFFGGLIIGILLAEGGGPAGLGSHLVYAASLAGSGVGCLGALWGIDALGGERTVVLASITAGLAAAAFAFAAPGGPWRSLAVALPAALLALVVASPSFLSMDLSEYKGLSAALRYPGAEVVATEWDRGTRVDHVHSEGIRSLPGLSLAYRGPLPTQEGLTFDGDDLSPIPLAEPERAPFAPYLLNSLAFSLRPEGHAAVLEPRGGLDVLVALAAGSARVTAVEPLGPAVAAASGANPNVYGDARVTVIEEDPRSFLARTGSRFDVVDLALTAPYRPVTSGAYSLAEDYTITTQAFEDYLSRLSGDGMLSVLRWIQQPPSEGIRVVATAAEAVRRVGGDPGEAIVVVRGYATMLVLVQPDGFSASDMAEIRAFAVDRRFDLVAGPGVLTEEANRFNLLPADRYRPLAEVLLQSANPGAVSAEYEFDVTPPTDDRPFFGHFFKWAQAPEVFDALGRTWQPFGGAGYFVLLALLAVSIAGAATLILAPLALSPRLRRAGSRSAGLKSWTVAYFSLLGLAFLFVEIPLIQRYILLTGNPTAALAVVLFVVLVSSGAGSFWSPRLPWWPGGATLTVLVAAYGLGLGAVIDSLMGAPWGLRIVAGGLVLAPIGVLMGIMFPLGLRHLERYGPELVPWAWGINGTVSVISGAASALLALSFGFTAVLLTGAAAYGTSALLAGRVAPGAAELSPRRG